jgi:hypothetical protein
MAKLSLQLFAWLTVTGGYFLFSKFWQGRSDLIQAAYFILGALPSVLIYRFASFKYLQDLTRSGEINARSLQVQVLGTVSPVFLHRLFFTRTLPLDPRGQLLLRTQFLVSVAILGTSIAILKSTA